MNIYIHMCTDNLFKYINSFLLNYYFFKKYMSTYFIYMNIFYTWVEQYIFKCLNINIKVQELFLNMIHLFFCYLNHFWQYFDFNTFIKITYYKAVPWPTHIEAFRALLKTSDMKPSKQCCQILMLHHHICVCHFRLTCSSVWW